MRVGLISDTHGVLHTIGRRGLQARVVGLDP
jgi:hypothetical protein